MQTHSFAPRISFWNKRLWSFIFSLVLISASFPVRAAPSDENFIYLDSLQTSWDDWSWTNHDLHIISPVHSGIYSIGVTYNTWEGLSFHYPELSTIGYDDVRFFIHGGTTGGQVINIFVHILQAGSELDGPAIRVPAPLANTWSEVRIPLADLGAANATINRITWQDASGKSQPTFYLDDISLFSQGNPDAPQLTDGYVGRRSVPADGSTSFFVSVRASDPQGLSDIATITLDAGLGGGVVALQDQGLSGDGQPQDGLFSAVINVAPGTPAGEKSLSVTATDQAGHQTSMQLGTLVVLAPPGGQIPAALPSRIGWGSNAWSETPGEDWQVNSGVPWDYVYQDITWGWESQGNQFVQRFVTQAWQKHFIPVVTVYMILGLPLTCGEGPDCYAQKLQDPTAVAAYLASLELAASQAQGAQPVIFNLEPDFYGFMQQYTNGSNPPAGINPDDPSSIPIALNLAGYENNLAGFGQRIVDVLHATASNALVAPMASMWATNQEPNQVTSAEAVQIAQRTAAFIDAMGGDRADLLVVEWSNRDAGRNIRPWWDVSDTSLPRPTRAILWENALSQAAHKRLLLWQVPVGNMSQDNTDNHYQDNRAAYLFSHPRDIFDAGVFGVLFGGGDSLSTQVWTDGGFVSTQGGIAYAPPSVPLGLAAKALDNNQFMLTWNENTEPDFWEYRLAYQPVSGGQTITTRVGGQNSFRLWLPETGDWQVRVAAIDAMGQPSAWSDPLTLTASGNPVFRLYFPLARR